MKFHGLREEGATAMRVTAVLVVKVKGSPWVELVWRKVQCEGMEHKWEDGRISNIYTGSLVKVIASKLIIATV